MEEVGANEAKRQKLATEEQLRKDAERKIAKIERENEKLVKQLMKEQDRKKREEERLALKKRKEEERILEKKRKEEEKQVERIRREEEKQNERIRKEEEKAAEKKRKEEEKLRVSQDQSKINAFFNIVSKKALVSDPPASDYEQNFLPFSLRRGGQLFDTVCNAQYTNCDREMDPKLWLQKLNQLNKPEIVPKDSFKNQLLSARDSSEVSAVLASLQFQRLQFSYLRQQHVENQRLPVNEEHRPPFVGFKQALSLETRLALCRDPLKRLEQEPNYDYDSELEWVDEEDGEDVRFEESDDESGGEQYELNEFLSDDENSTKKPAFTGPLTPKLVWNEPLIEYKAVIFEYPEDLPSSQPEEAVQTEIKPEIDSIDDFKQQLDALSSKVGFDLLKQSLLSTNNSPATKTLHVELLKQQFPQATEKELKRAFDLCAIRVGKKKVEKKWVLTPQAELYFGVK